MRAIHPQANSNATPIGAKLRSVRTGQGLSLGQLAESTGLSKGFLSRVERDETSPSVSTLVQLCQVLSLPVGALFAEPEIQRVTFADAPRINLGGVHADERLMSPRGEQRVQLLRSELEPDAHGGSDLYTINCDVEVLHVLNGSVTVRFADRTVALSAGDALTLPGREPHTWHVEGGEPASIIWVIIPAPWSGSA
ncbi:cupin [Pseudoclavibacter endophyticus]|uniref:Helix-turn-helix domain-containing protein n=1 Tax=Pseudoclavibacter endophyticus TaxID=1778590 RepID=A0A6H9WRY3_9MICO|nr:helix-turn-helix domain-containing protein [Pseudoclavibacter endophyticus]KAB1649535.1 helix-turn-helix domain-containing protein [Pseudoclavibacter endophyticus]GGA61848.1 cupin [Pseudoclavibacter endophyticus]